MKRGRVLEHEASDRPECAGPNGGARLVRERHEAAGVAPAGSRPLRFATWNILHGGGPRRIPEIALALVAHCPDLLVLTEFRAARGGQLRAVLSDHGLAFHATNAQPDGVNGVLIASRWPVAVVEEHAGEGCDGRRFLVASIDTAGLRVIGVHMPPDRAPGVRARHWKRLIEMAGRWSEHCAVIAGDFNAGRRDLDGPGEFCREGPFLGALATMGYADAWRALHGREREASWCSHGGRGFRLDHVWVSRALAGHVAEAFYSHSERMSGTSDHSMLMVTLHLGGERRGQVGRDGSGDPSQPTGLETGPTFATL